MRLDTMNDNVFSGPECLLRVSKNYIPGHVPQYLEWGLRISREAERKPNERQIYKPDISYRQDSTDKTLKAHTTGKEIRKVKAYDSITTQEVRGV